MDEQEPFVVTCAHDFVARKQGRMKISVVIPVFNERETLGALVESITEHIAPHEHRILFIDDGSTDDSFEVLCALQKRYETVDIIRFRRNFGKSTALAAGFAKAEGDLVLTMDADLQDDPKEIPRFIEKIEEGYDVVAGWKRQRYDPWHKTLPSRVFNAVVGWLFGLALHDVNCGFKAYRMEVVNEIPLYGELHRLLPVLAAQRGYRVGEIVVEHHPRQFGRSKYGIERFARGALDALSVWFLGRYGQSPGHFFGSIGVATIALGLFSLLVALLRWATVEKRFAGLALALVGAILVCGGILNLGLGLIAELAVRQHPPLDPDLHIADERLGTDEHR